MNVRLRIFVISIPDSVEFWKSRCRMLEQSLIQANQKILELSGEVKKYKAIAVEKVISFSMDKML
jgi:hypothetical protein